MNFLVIGGEGFIGKNLVKEIDKKHNVKKIDIDDLDVRLEMDWVDFFIPLRRFDYIYYLSAVSDIARCNANASNAFATNVNGLIYLLEQIKEQNSILVFSSSVYVYNENSGIYGITKRTAEAVIKWYSKNHGLDYRILRYGSVYGTGSNENNAIYRMIKNALDTGVISYYGSGEEIREYIHVKDVVKYSLEILDSKYKNKTLALCGHYPIKAKDMCYMLREILGQEYVVEFGCQTPPGHYVFTPYSYTLDVSEKYMSDTYYDLGSGLLDLIREIKSKE